MHLFFFRTMGSFLIVPFVYIYYIGLFFNLKEIELLKFCICIFDTFFKKHYLIFTLPKCEFAVFSVFVMYIFPFYLDFDIKCIWSKKETVFIGSYKLFFNSELGPLPAVPNSYFGNWWFQELYKLLQVNF